MIIGEMVNLQKADFSKPSTSWPWGHFMFGLTFGQVDFLEVDYFS
jgi:hypothetical protein